MNRAPITFRDRKIAASLKPKYLRESASGDHGFPRSKDRGLIEATLRPITVGVYAELSAIERSRPH